MTRQVKVKKVKWLDSQLDDTWRQVAKCDTTGSVAARLLCTSWHFHRLLYVTALQQRNRVAALRAWLAGSAPPRPQRAAPPVQVRVIVDVESTGGVAPPQAWGLAWGSRAFVFVVAGAREHCAAKSGGGLYTDLGGGYSLVDLDRIHRAARFAGFNAGDAGPLVLHLAEAARAAGLAVQLPPGVAALGAQLGAMPGEDELAAWRTVLCCCPSGRTGSAEPVWSVVGRLRRCPDYSCWLHDLPGACRQLTRGGRGRVQQQQQQHPAAAAFAATMFEQRATTSSDSSSTEASSSAEESDEESDDESDRES